MRRLVDKAAAVGSFLRENGIFISLLALSEKVRFRTYSALISTKVGARNLYIESPAYLRGVSHIHIGPNFRAGRGLWLEAISRWGDKCYHPTIKIGVNVVLSRYVHIAATNYIEIGSNVLMGSKVLISDHNHGKYDQPHPSGSPFCSPSHRVLSAEHKVVVGENVWLGDGVVLLPGVTIGEGSIIGANSVVSKDIPPFSIAAGAPARVLKTYDRDSEEWHAVRG
jgi:acetyltransferase-like isoleucine patch superfamily enzyme